MAVMDDELFEAQTMRALGYAPYGGADAAEGDDLSAFAPRLHEALRCPKELIEFTRAEGAGEHCESGARVLFHQRAFAWLDEALPATG